MTFHDTPRRDIDYHRHLNLLVNYTPFPLCGSKQRLGGHGMTPLYPVSCPIIELIEDLNGV